MKKKNKFLKEEVAKQKRIWGIKCGRCSQRLFSLFTHDFHYCKCGGTSVDGGQSYLGYGWDPKVGEPSRIYWTTKLDGEYPNIKDTARFPY